MSTRIFVSYAREDEISAGALVTFLEAAGFDTWFDKKDLLGGQDWRRVIKQEIACARLLILCLSRNSVAKTGFVQEEMKLAMEQARLRPTSQVYIMPVKLDDCDIPDEFQYWHCLDLREEKASLKLLASIQNATGDGARAPESAHLAFANAISGSNSTSGSSGNSSSNLSVAAQELLQLIEKEPNLELRGIVQIAGELQPRMTAYYPSLQYSGDPLSMRSRLFRNVVDELVDKRVLYRPDYNIRTGTVIYEFRGEQ